MVQKYPTLKAWSWQDIQKVYKILGSQLNDCKDVTDKFEMQLPLTPKPGEIISYKNKEGQTNLIANFYALVNRINTQIQALDKEIARRNKLIGVMG